MRFLKYFTMLILLLVIGQAGTARETNALSSDNDSSRIITLKNDKVKVEILLVNDGFLLEDRIMDSHAQLTTDADFAFEITWTDWRAPAKQNNADNPARLTKKDFRFTSSLDKGKQEVILNFTGKDQPLLLQISYRLEEEKAYYRRKLRVIDTTQETHFLQTCFAREGKISSKDDKGPLKSTILKKGEFGQPIALQFGSSGMFAGLEYPAATNEITAADEFTVSFRCFQEVGCKINRSGFESEWVVIGLVPDPYVKNAFLEYVKDIRVAPAEPFTLYNSWYDLRSPEYPKVKPENVMNQDNVFKIIDLFRKNMIDKHKIQLDAFVLDDGWDIYESDWKLRPETFPNGLKPLSDKLKPLGTRLGIWFGPTGGYSFRMKRVNWMKGHGYETVGKGRDYAMLCMGGTNYSRLFKLRTTEFVKNEGVSYFKWDGIQFSCSEPDHGHPVGLYSRRAILDSVIDKCKAVRAINPATYLNITSGTWLSPWWVKYANQIWMDGEDYGYADVPSIHQRDGAITYRDFVLYDDFHNKDLWFPIANLMTHGIIKGNLERLGGETDPIDKFSKDVMLYFARGISMYELYISPDLLTDAEWDAIGKDINWAKDRKEILANTFMVGGDPTQRATYGYTHFKGAHGIVAARNPVIQAGNLSVRLDPEQGFDPAAKNLVVEQIYPYRYIFPDLYASGATVDVPLEGFETAILEIYPLEEATMPLFSGLPFDGTINKDGSYSLNFYGFSPKTKVLNPGAVKSMLVNETKGLQLQDLPQPRLRRPVLQDFQFKLEGAAGKELPVIELSMDTTATEASLSLLFKPAKEGSGQDFPVFVFTIDGKEVKPAIEKEKGLWAWYTFKLNAGTHTIAIKAANDTTNWKGTAQAWFLCQSPSYKQTIHFIPKTKFRDKTMPALPLQPGIFERHFDLGVKDILLHP